jgi:hypothetical protein
VDNLSIKILLSLLGITFTGAIGFWLGILKERINGIENRIIEEKLKLMPELEHIILTAPAHPPFRVFVDIIDKIDTSCGTGKFRVQGVSMPFQEPLIR